MARPKEFNRDQAIESAKNLFWRKGFAALSTDELRLEMGIGRQSFYDTFKGKQQLYVEVLRKYNGDLVSSYAAISDRSSSPAAAIREILITIASEPVTQRTLGCLGVSSVCEFGTSNKSILEIHKLSGDALTRLLENVVKEGKDQGEFRESLNPQAAARFLLSTLSGMKVSSRAGASAEVLRDIVNVAVDGMVSHNR